MLFSPAPHEPLTGATWDAARARDAVAAIIIDAGSAFDDGWPVHPRDAGDWLPEKPRTLYLGGAGVVATLQLLGSERDWVPYLEAALERAREE